MPFVRVGLGPGRRGGPVRPVGRVAVVVPVARGPGPGRGRGPVVPLHRRRMRRRAIVLRPRRIRWVPVMVTYFMVKRSVDKSKVKHEQEVELQKSVRVEEVAMVSDRETNDLVVADENHRVCEADKHHIVNLSELTEVTFHYEVSGQKHTKVCYADRKCATCGQHFFCYEDASQAPLPSAPPASSAPASMAPSPSNPYPMSPYGINTSQQAPPRTNPAYVDYSRAAPPAYETEYPQAPSQVAKVPIAAAVFCDKCFSPNTGAKFCGECGNKF